MNTLMKRTLIASAFVFTSLAGLGACSESESPETSVTNPQQEVEAKPVETEPEQSEAPEGLSVAEYKELMGEHMQLTADGLGYFGEFYIILSQDASLIGTSEAEGNMTELENLFDASVDSAQSFVPPAELEEFHNEYVDILMSLRDAVYLANEGARDMDVEKMNEASSIITSNNERILDLANKIK